MNALSLIADREALADERKSVIADQRDMIIEPKSVKRVAHAVTRSAAA